LFAFEESSISTNAKQQKYLVAESTLFHVTKTEKLDRHSHW